MIGKIILRWLWIGLAFCISALLAVITLFTLGSLWAGEALREGANAQGDWIIWEASDVLGALFFVGATGPALTAIPGLAAVLVGEIFHIRSALYYIAAGGAALAAIPLLAGAADPSSLPARDYMTIFASAGFVAGLAYWALAGRGA